MIKEPYYNSRGDLYYDFQSYATSGVIVTEHYGEEFQQNLVEKIVSHKISILSPSAIAENDNFTLHFKIEKVQSTLPSSKDKITLMNVNLGINQSLHNASFSPPGFRKYATITRNFDNSDLAKVDLKMMPGFKLNWWHTGSEEIPTPDLVWNRDKGKQGKKSKHFVR